MHEPLAIVMRSRGEAAPVRKVQGAVVIDPSHGHVAALHGTSWAEPQADPPVRDGIYGYVDSILCLMNCPVQSHRRVAAFFFLQQHLPIESLAMSTRILHVHTWL